MANRSGYRNYRNLYSETCDDEPLSWEPFYDFLAKPQFLPYVESILEICKARALKTRAFSEFSELVQTLHERTGIDDILAHDGSEVPMSNNALGVENYYVNAPALKLHASVSLLSFCTLYNAFTPGQADERINLCDDEVNTLRNKLFTCDAGYCSDNVYEKVMSQGGFFLIKLRGNCGFKVEAVQKLTTKRVAGAPVVPVEKGKYKNKVLKVSQVKVNQEQAADFIAVTANGIRVSR